jgi:hypothetical protein
MPTNVFQPTVKNRELCVAGTVFLEGQEDGGDADAGGSVNSHCCVAHHGVPTNEGRMHKRLIREKRQ